MSKFHAYRCNRCNRIIQTGDMAADNMCICGGFFKIITQDETEIAQARVLLSKQVNICQGLFNTMASQYPEAMEKVLKSESYLHIDDITDDDVPLAVRESIAQRERDYVLENLGEFR